MVQISFGAAEYETNAVAISASHFGVVVKEASTGGYSNEGRNLVGLTGSDPTVPTVAAATATNTTVSMAALGAGSIRYPGGTEGRDFDLTDPDQVAGLKRALVYCAKNNVALNLTINDKVYLDPANANNDPRTASMTAAERTAFQNFIRVEVLNFADSIGARIESIHIGNEVAGQTASYGAPAWKGYANSAAFMINELDAVLTTYTAQTGKTAPQIVIEPPNWVANGQQTEFFNILQASGAMAKLDAVDLHGNGGGTSTQTLALGWDSYFGPTATDSYESRLQRIIDYWRDHPTTSAVDTSHVQIRVDAWSYDTVEGSSLRNAALGMLQMHAFSKLGIISASNYLGYGTDTNALVRPNADQANLSSVGMTAGGQLFALMSGALKGTQAITLAGAPTLTDEASATSLTRAFAGDDRLVLYVVNRGTTDLPVDIDTSALTGSMETFAGGVKAAEASIIGVTNATQATSFAGVATL